MMIVGFVVTVTATPDETVCVKPQLSVTVALIVYAPAFAYACCTTALPVTAPRSCICPSPQFTVRSRTRHPLVVAAVTANVYAAGSPAPGGVVGGVMTICGAPAIAIVIVAVLCVDVGVDGVVGVVPVPPPPVPGVVVEPPCAPTLAVTVAWFDVVSRAVAMPLWSVLTTN